MVTFSGFSPAAVGFYERLERDNSREFWAAEKTAYEQLVRDPMRALLAELETEFGTGKVFRPNRDTRFSANKAPYKTHQGAFIEGPSAGPGSTPGTGFYVEISSRGLLAGGGFHAHSSGQTARYRAAVADDTAGPRLEAIVDDLGAKDFDIEGEQVKTAPRGYPADHPRIELLRFKELMVFRRFGTPVWFDSPRTLEEVRETWRAVRPLSEWVAVHAPAD
jgi:uncharacterized protein (TIGR02453 family)